MHSHTYTVYTCKREIFSQPWQIIVLSSLCRSDPSVLPFFLFLPLYFLPLDIYPGIHLSAYPYIDVSIYLFYLSRPFIPLPFAHLPLEFTGTLIHSFVSILELSFFPCYSLGTYYFCTNKLQRYPLNLFVKLFSVSMCSCSYLKFYHEDARV